MKKWIHFIRQEVVLSVAVFLAAISMFWVPPSKEYASYMNWHVLSLLLCLMLVMEGLKQLGVFSAIAGRMMRKVKSYLQVVLVLVFLCFFSSMLITNDVALITFVPFAIEVLRMAGKEKSMIGVIVLQTIAANLGSMLTPIGNPQNLYLYDHAEFSPAGFLATMFFPCLISGALLLASSIRIAKDETMDDMEFPPIRYWTKKRKILTGLYVALFVVNLFVVAEVISFGPALLITLISVFLADRKTMKGVDYCLLLTFCGFFVFVGNMGNIERIALLLEKLMQGREFFVAVLTSQVISNVPAALLLSGFTQDYKALLLGVNIGGLGTLIASMASLISYKFYAKAYPEQKGRYMGHFTKMNLLYLAIFCIIYFCISL